MSRDIILSPSRSSCPQTNYDLVKPAAISWFTPFYTQTRSEDCLYLNIWTSGLNDGGKRPVMVWLHGGGYARGSGASSSYEGTNIARRGDVVAITINHRLNTFGYTQKKWGGPDDGEFGVKS